MMADYDEAQIQALRALPYDEYLKTMHWQRQRKGALQRAAYSCQACKRSVVQLDVHHNTYDRLGCELPSDLFVFCHECHELFEQNRRLVKLPDEEEDDTLEWEETDVVPLGAEKVTPVRDFVVNHPRLTLNSGTVIASFAFDVVIHFDPFGVIVGLVVAGVVGWNSGSIVQGIQSLIPGADQEQVREDADHFADQFLADYPIYADQRVGAKLKRLFRISADDEIIDALPPKQKALSQQKRDRVKPAVNTSGEGLTFERIATWLEQGLINDVRFFELLERMENPQNRYGNRYRNDAKDEHEAASGEAVSPQIEPLRPAGWDDMKIQQFVGAYRVSGVMDDSLVALGFSKSQVNRNFARDILRQQGLWKEK